MISHLWYQCGPFYQLAKSYHGVRFVFCDKQLILLASCYELPLSTALTFSFRCAQSLRISVSYDITFFVFYSWVIMNLCYLWFCRFCFVLIMNFHELRLSTILSLPFLFCSWIFMNFRYLWLCRFLLFCLRVVILSLLLKNWRTLLSVAWVELLWGFCLYVVMNFRC